MFAWGDLRRHCRVRAVVRYSQHWTLPRPTESRLRVALLRPICKQRALPPQFPRSDFGRSGEHEAASKGPHSRCNDSTPLSRRQSRLARHGR